MEKCLKRLRIAIAILIVVLICALAFGGVYKKVKGVWTSVMPEFRKGIEFAGNLELRYVLDDSEEEKEVYVAEDGSIHGVVQSDDQTVSLATEEIPLTTEEVSEEASEEENNNDELSSKYKIETRTIKANEEENITIENLEKTKKLIQKRLALMGDMEYNIRLDNVNKELILEVADDDNYSLVQGIVTTVGKFDIIDHQTGEILMDKSYIKNAYPYTNTDNNTYTNYLIVEYNEEGKEILKEISNKYVSTTLEDGTEDVKYVTIQLEGKDLATTYFGEEMSNGMLQMPLGSATEDYSQAAKEYKEIYFAAYTIRNESLPLIFALSSDNLVNSPITHTDIVVYEIIGLVLIIAVSVYLIVKYKLKGLLVAVYDLGYIALLILAVRYTNVYVTVNSIVTACFMVAANYYFSIKFLNKICKEKQEVPEAFGEAMKEFYMVMIPVIIIALIFTLSSHMLIISSIGMMAFWGLFIQAIYDSVMMWLMETL